MQEAKETDFTVPALQPEVQSLLLFTTQVIQRSDHRSLYTSNSLIACTAICGGAWIYGKSKDEQSNKQRLHHTIRSKVICKSARASDYKIDVV